MGDAFTSKDFRTWGGSVFILGLLLQAEPAGSEREANHAIVEAIKGTAERLGNTPAVCRKCYIHPAVLDAFKSGRLVEPPARRAGRLSRLSVEERRLLRLLEATAAAQAA
jgi:DNA topoisomerase-1